MKRDTAIELPKSTFLCCEKDSATILKKLFVDYHPYSEMLKRLLVIQTKDCLDNVDSEIIKEKIANTTVASLVQDGCVRVMKKLKQEEFEDTKAYLIITMDDFAPNATNPYFSDCTIFITALCHTDYWDLGDFRQRPIKIIGYVDGILRDSRLSGLGQLNFLGCVGYAPSEVLSGYTIAYRAVHGNDDRIESEV